MYSNVAAVVYTNSYDFYSCQDSLVIMMLIASFETGCRNIYIYIQRERERESE